MPYLTGRVVDNAEILKPATRERIAALAKAHEDKTTDQIAVLTIPTLGGDSVEEFANRVFAAWKLGQKGKDNGVLVVVAPQDRKMRIEVGYGLEGTLTDVAASRIIRNVMTPAFKNGDFDRGIEDGVAAIVAQLEGQPASAGTTAALVDESSSGARKSAFTIEGPEIPWYMRILLGCFIFGVIGVFTVIGVMTPGMGWFLYVFLIPFWAMFPIIVIGPKATVGLLAALPARLSGREAVVRAAAVVREGRRGSEGEGHDDDRRHGHHVGRLVVERRQQRRRRVLGRRRQLGWRRRVGELVTRVRFKSWIHPTEIGPRAAARRRRSILAVGVR